MYLNDLQEYFENATSIHYYKLLLFLYAGNTILLAESSWEQIFPVASEYVSEYCQEWKLKNKLSRKTKISIFQKKEYPTLLKLYQ